VPLFYFIILSQKNLLDPDTKGLESRLTIKSLHCVMNKKSLVFHWVLGINYANNNYNTTRTHV
jgi:hypothetical protein